MCEGIVGHINKTGVVDNFVFLQAPNVVLATGGIGSIYAHTTNPRDIYGEGIAMAAKAGAKLKDMEFVQFHPTALDIGLDPAPLLTEAIRGEGAFLVDEDQNRFMLSVHPDKELAPRDVVARTIFRQQEKGRSTFLDCRHFIKGNFKIMFPTANEFLAKANIDPEKDLIPIIPAAHYHMGGIQVDLNGKSSVEGLWACGETSSTGAHGANRLASNSLLEAFVFARKIAQTINSRPISLTKLQKINIDNYFPKEKTISKVRAKKYIWQLRSNMTRNVGLERSKQSLIQAFIEFDRIERESKHLSAKLKDMILVSRLITYAALAREESRGTHFRNDFSETIPHFNKSLDFDIKDMTNFLNNITNKTSIKTA
jgi:L-aspartate oxidase